MVIEEKKKKIEDRGKNAEKKANSRSPAVYLPKAGKGK